MLYHFGFILVLATAAHGQEWFRKFRTPRPKTSTLYSTTPNNFPPLDYPTTVPEWVQPKSKNLQVPEGLTVLGYKPVYGPRKVNPADNVPKLSQDWDFQCPKRFGYYRYKRSCDIYIECRNYQPSRKVCPDGTHFKENPRWSEYPCGYPPEALCQIPKGSLAARPTAECPHQFGNYPITNEQYSRYERCSRYISCAAGVAHVVNCTFGLVFNPAINLCDWPEKVPDCKDVFVFNCPVSYVGEDDIVINYRYPGDLGCRYFYSCLNGAYKVLACDEGLFFDHTIGRCVEDDFFICDNEIEYPTSNERR